MTVRLGFAVAAHLEPEILVIDEVLAVGDAEFQKRAVGKMQEVSSKEGKTVLFVSHNMGAVKNLCGKGLLLKEGMVKCSGEIDKIIEQYFYEQINKDGGIRTKMPVNSLGYFANWRIEGNRDEDYSIYSDENFSIVFIFKANERIENCELGLVFRDLEGRIILGCNSRDFGGNFITIERGIYKFMFDLNLPIINGDYELDIAIVNQNRIVDQWVSSTMLKVKNKFESVLDQKWRGELNVKTCFRYDKA